MGAVDPKLLLDQREANERLVLAALQAQELAEEAETRVKNLEEMKKELLATAEFREQLLGMVGHDLRNPLSAILMAAGVLSHRGSLDQTDALLATRIIASGNRMARMIAQLLDFTRARLGGGIALQPERIDLRALCRQVVEELTLRPGTRIDCEYQGDLSGTWDADRLAEVLSNILGNATEHAAPGTPILLKACGERGQVVVEISNQGAPIPPEVLPYIFSAFRRGRQETRSSVGNLGLGLYIASQIVVAHGGTLAAQSAGGTTTFTMRLPRAPAAPPAADTGP